MKRSRVWKQLLKMKFLRLKSKIVVMTLSLMMRSFLDEE